MMSVGGGAVILIGAPGVGKSTLGRYLTAAVTATTHFLSVGDVLRERGLVQQQLERPTAARRSAMRREARELLRTACLEWKEAAAVEAEADTAARYD
jgi:adenylate kinase family enzyme